MIKITSKSKLFIWINGPEARGGGPEVLNMLASKLKKLGVDAYAFNWSYPSPYPQADYYKNLYDINCGCWEDIKDTDDYIILLPEIMIENPDNLSYFISHYKNVQFIIWWLGTGFQYTLKDFKTSKRKQLDLLKAISEKTLHLCESELAMRDLLYYGLEARMIFQHGVNELYYTNKKYNTKDNIVFYNGLKKMTADFIQTNLIPICPDIKFEGLFFEGNDKFKSKEDMCALYDKAKIYIDFCEFEGREMMPREAALRDCIIYLGDSGNASTFDDYPIPNYYKVNKYGDYEDLCNKLRQSLSNYDNEIELFTFFKNKCKYEPLKFEWEIRNIFGPMIKNDNFKI